MKQNQTSFSAFVPAQAISNNNVESFSFYLGKDKKIDKGSKIEVSSYSQSSFGKLGNPDYKTGRFYSDSGGLFMVTATFHVKTEAFVVPGIYRVSI